MIDKLTEIARKDLPLLRDLYKADSSRRYTTNVIIDTYIKWIQQDPNIEYLHFYCLNGDLSHGTFVVFDRATAYADTFHESTDELLRLLLLVDYSKGYLFIHVSDRVAEVIKKALKRKNLEIIFDDSFLEYFLPKEVGLQFNIQPPDGIELRPVTQRSDLEKAFSVWPATAGGRRSLQFLLRQAKYNCSVGAFKNDGTLVAWVFRFPTGNLMALQTDENHFGHGFGSLVAKAISKQIAEMGYNIHAGVSEKNLPSKALFEKLGFRSSGKIYVLGTKLHWPEVDE